jgi:hypothetical protein
MLLKLAYLGVSNIFAMLRLLSMSDRVEQDMMMTSHGRGRWSFMTSPIH